ncbi:MAG TPA: TetR/AcrR family transcriptional regulator, partial [Pseudonocardiaceae bacterium]
RDGFHQTAMPDIAREAGVSVGAPYRYFASKEELILELAGDAFTAIFEPMVATPEPTGIANPAAGAPEPSGIADLVAGAIGASPDDLVAGVPEPTGVVDLVAGAPERSGVADLVAGVPEPTGVADLVAGVPEPSGVADVVAGATEPTSVADLVARAIEASPGDELLRCAVQAWSELLINDAVRERAIAGFEDVRLRLAAVLRRGQDAGTVPLALDPERGARVIMALLHGFLLQRVAFGLDDVAGFVSDVRALLGG